MLTGRRHNNINMVSGVDREEKLRIPGKTLPKTKVAILTPAVRRPGQLTILSAQQLLAKASGLALKAKPIPRI